MEVQKELCRQMRGQSFRRLQSGQRLLELRSVTTEVTMNGGFLQQQDEE